MAWYTNTYKHIYTCTNLYRPSLGWNVQNCLMGGFFYNNQGLGFKGYKYKVQKSLNTLCSELESNVIKIFGPCQGFE